MPPENENAAAAPTKKKLPIKSALIIALILLAEGGLLVGYMAFAKPSSADAGVLGGDVAPPPAAVGEAIILEDRMSNMRSGRPYLYDLRICVEVDAEDLNDVKEKLAKRDAYIHDSIRTVFAQADPQYLEEPELQTMKRKVHEILEEVLGEGRVQKVLFPKYLRYRAQ